MCFNGQVKCLWLDRDRNTNHKRGFWDAGLNYMEVKYLHPVLPAETKLPHNIKEMMEVASKLSEDFPHARIDLYNVDGKIYFGEITYYCSSGYCPFEPDSFDFELGESFKEYS